MSEIITISSKPKLRRWNLLYKAQYKKFIRLFEITKETNRIISIKGLTKIKKEKSPITKLENILRINTIKIEHRLKIQNGWRR